MYAPTLDVDRGRTWAPQCNAQMCPTFHARTRAHIRLDTQAPWCSKHVPHISRYYWGSQWAVHLSHGTLLTSTGVECDLETPRAKEKSNFQLLPNSKGVTTASATTYLIWQVFTTDAFVYSMEPFTDTHKGNVV